MRIQAYTAYTGALTITVATPRPEAAGSIMFTAATIHEDYAANVRAVLEEHQHCGDTSLAYPAARRLSTYFPTAGSPALPLFALRMLRPMGSPRDIDAQFMLEIMRLRYAFLLVLLPPAFIASASIREAKERHLEYAINRLFDANGVPNTFIPGDQTLRNQAQSEIDIVCELGEASERVGVDIPSP